MSNWPYINGSGQSETLGRSGGSGVSVTSGGSAGVKGSWVTLGTTSFAWDWFCIMSGGIGVGRPIQFDVGIGATPDIIVADAFCRTGSSADGAIQSSLPIRVPAGVPVKIRTTSNSGSVTANNVIITGFAADYQFKGFRRAEQLNTMSGAFPVNGPTGASTSLSGFAEIISATQGRYGALLVQQWYSATSTAMDVFLDVAIGALGQENIIGTLLSRHSQPVRFSDYMFLCNVPQGTRISAQIQCSTTFTAQLTPSIMGLIP